MHGVLQAREALRSMVTCAPAGSVKNCTLCSGLDFGGLNGTGVELARSGRAFFAADSPSSCGVVSCGAVSVGPGVDGVVSGAVASGAADGPGDGVALSGDWDWPTGLGFGPDASPDWPLLDTEPAAAGEPGA
jgi:hypothetical protein